jgi:hypothetical protein
MSEEGTVLFSVSVRFRVWREPGTETEIDDEVYSAIRQLLQPHSVDSIEINEIPEPPDATIIAFPARD